jgi:hypothetical protein
MTLLRAQLDLTSLLVRSVASPERTASSLCSTSLGPLCLSPNSASVQNASQRLPPHHGFLTQDSYPTILCRHRYLDGQIDSMRSCQSIGE